MRLFTNLIYYALLLVPALAASQKSASDRFDDFHAKSLASAPLKLADSSFGRLTRVPRDYSVAVLLTALDPRFGCRLCHDIQPEWNMLARSWTKGDSEGESRLIYGTLDFMNGKESFQSVRSECRRTRYTC